MEYFKQLEGTDGLWEVRTAFGGDAFRLLGFWDAGCLIILTNGFSKGQPHSSWILFVVF